MRQQVCSDSSLKFTGSMLNLLFSLQARKLMPAKKVKTLFNFDFGKFGCYEAEVICRRFRVGAAKVPSQNVCCHCFLSL